MQDNLIFVKKPEKCKKMYVYEENWRSHRSLCVIKIRYLNDGSRGKVSQKLRYKLSESHQICVEIFRDTVCTFRCWSAFVQKEKWLRLLILAFGNPSRLVLTGSVVNPAAWTVAGALIQAPPPKALMWVSFIMLPSLLQSDGFDKTRSSHQLLRVIFYPLLRALRDCTLSWRPPLRQTPRAKPDWTEQNKQQQQ